MVRHPHSFLTEFIPELSFHLGCLAVAVSLPSFSGDWKTSVDVTHIELSLPPGRKKCLPCCGCYMILQLNYAYGEEYRLPTARCSFLQWLLGQLSALSGLPLCNPSRDQDRDTKMKKGMRNGNIWIRMLIFCNSQVTCIWCWKNMHLTAAVTLLGSTLVFFLSRSYEWEYRISS